MDQTNLPSIHLNEYEPVPADILTLFPEGLIKKNLIVPVAMREGRLVAAVPQTDGIVKPAGLKLIAGCEVDLVLAPLSEIISFIKNHYKVEVEEKSIPTENTEPLLAVPSEYPPLVIQLMTEAVKNRASEVLMDLKGPNLRIRQRIRGVVVPPPPGTVWTKEQAQSLFDWVRKSGEVLDKGSIKWTELRRRIPSNKDPYECIFTLSDTAHLSLLTVRLNPYQEAIFSPTTWGMDPHQAKNLESLLMRQQGVLLFCGAEEDGIDRTLNACVRKLALSQKHIITVESSIQEWIKDVDQFEGGADDELFDQHLTTALSHHPDVLVVNPLNRRGPFETVFKESLKGSLILGLSYGRDSAESVANAVRLTGDPYLVSSSLIGVVTQRRIRLNCPHCQQKEIVPRDRAKEIGIPIELHPPAFFAGAGCAHCSNTGSDRETQIFEVLILTDEIKNAIHKEASAEKIRQIAKGAGVLMLRHVAINKVVSGQISISEVIRATPR